MKKKKLNKTIKDICIGLVIIFIILFAAGGLYTTAHQLSQQNIIPLVWVYVGLSIIIYIVMEILLVTHKIGFGVIDNTEDFFINNIFLIFFCLLIGFVIPNSIITTVKFILNIKYWIGFVVDELLLGIYYVIYNPTIPICIVGVVVFIVFKMWLYKIYKRTRKK